MLKKINKISITLIFFLFFSANSEANFQEKIIKKYEMIDTLYFDFTQKIGNKTENGNCYIKYPLLMKCEYPKKKKSIVTDGKKFAIIKKRYKKIYYYPLKKTPLFYILNKKNILNVIKNYEPKHTSSNIVEYELVDNNSNKINIFFQKDLLELAGWKTIDAYSNKVIFSIENTKINIPIKKEFFKIPRQEDL